MLKYLAMGILAAGLSFVQAQQGLTAKQRVEYALKQFSDASVKTVRIKRFSLSSFNGPAVDVLKYDRSGLLFIQTTNIGTQHRGVLYEETNRGNVGKYWYARQALKIQSLGSDYFKSVQARHLFWLSQASANISQANVIKAIEVEDVKLSVVEIKSVYGKGYLLLDEANQLRGYANYSSQDAVFRSYYVCSTTSVKGYNFFNLCHDYNDKFEIVYSSRLIDADINPRFTDEDWKLNVVETKRIDGGNPYGLNIVPSNEFELTGALVTPPVLRGAALKAGLGFGDEIVSINGKNVTKMVFSEAEAMFWGTKKLKLTVKTKKGATKTVTLSIK